MPREEFHQTFAAIKTLPGPVAFQMVVISAYRRGTDVHAGFLAATLAALCFVLPSMILMMTFALTRSLWGTWIGGFLVGIQAAALGLILFSVIALARSAQSAGSGEFQQLAKWMFALFGFVVTLLRPSLEPMAIVVCGLLALAPFRNQFFGAAVAAGSAVPTALIGVSTSSLYENLFLTTLKGGALVFGSGLAIVPILGGEFVDRLQWISHTEFLEALSFGQVTPGPLLITATYIGTRVAGIGGGLVATFGIFIVPFLHMTTWFPRFWKHVSNSAQWKRFSFGAISAVLGAVVASVIKLLEPIVLTALEIETPQINRTTVSFVLWIVLVPLSFFLIYKNKQPAWAVLLGSGLLACAALIWF